MGDYPVPVALGAVGGVPRPDWLHYLRARVCLSSVVPAGICNSFRPKCDPRSHLAVFRMPGAVYARTGSTLED